MAIWLGKQLLGQRDRVENVLPLTPDEARNMSTEQLDALNRGVPLDP